MLINRLWLWVQTVTANIRYHFHLEQCSLHFSSTITTVWLHCKSESGTTLLQYWSKFKCHHTFVSFLYPQQYFTAQTVRWEHKTTNVIICTYWWWPSVNGEREIKQDKRLGPVRSVQCAVSRKTLKYSHSRHFVKLVWATFLWSSRTLCQCQVTKWGFCTGFQWCYVSCNAGNLHLWEGMTSLCCSALRWRSWMRNCPAGSSPDGVIGILHDLNSSSLAMACGWPSF